ncbi:MAG: hypothetical protein Kow0062_15570 [Acidobacteriota bacterium]|nr:MAG: PAS domain-containing protein [Acidobacteriota bacterium]
MSEERSGSTSTQLDAGHMLGLFDRAGVHWAILDRECRVQAASPGLLASRGPRVVGSHCHEGLWRRESDCRACLIEEVYRTGEPRSFWVPVLRPGALGPRHLVHQIPLDDGRVLEAIVDTGVPEQFFPELILRERILLHGLRRVPVGVLLLDASMHVVAANPAVLAMLRVGEEEIKGRPLDALLPDGALPARGRELARLLARHAAITDREIVLEADGSRRVVLASIAAVVGRGASLNAAVVILTDITRERTLNEELARKVAELTLLREYTEVLSHTARLEQVLRVVLATLVHPGGLGLGAAAVFLVDEQQRRLEGALARAGGPSGAGVGRARGPDLEALAFAPASEEDEALERRVRDVHVPLEEGRHPLVEALAGDAPRVIDAGGPDDGIEPALARVFGRRAVYLVGLQYQGRPLGVLAGAARDGRSEIDPDQLSLGRLVASTAAGAIARAHLHEELTGRLEDLAEVHGRLRHMQAQLLREERRTALGDLAAEIVHQIRNPLAVVGGFARRIARKLAPGDPIEQDVRILVEETARMESILERIRHDVRLARRPARVRVDPADLVQAAAERYRALARDRQVSLRAEIEPGIPPAQGSREHLLEVLDNLLSNAFDAVEPGGTVTLRALRLKDAVHIVVEDDGIGLAAEELERIFEPSYTTKADGTGLGLPLARRLVAQCGGTLTVDSRPGEGARFRIVLPVWARDTDAAERETGDDRTEG